MLKSLILFIFLISSLALGNEKITGSYVGEIEDKYKNTYPVTSNLEISDGGVIKEHMNISMVEKIGMVFSMMES